MSDGETRETAAQRARHLNKAAGGAIERGLAHVQSLIMRAGPDRLVAPIQARWHTGALSVHWPGGATSRLVGDKDGPQGVINVNNWRFVRRVLTGGGVGFARAYIDGDWDSPALDEVIEVAALNRGSAGDGWKARGMVSWLGKKRHKARANTKKKAKDNISFHYDLGNDFYRVWLDETMTYSAALFAADDLTLADAQREKYRRLIREMDIKPGESVLEIGCGWGGFAEVAAGEFGARVHGITLSEEQLAYAQKRMARAGLSDQVTLELRDYRDVAQEFDHVASIEMFEAVGEEFWPTYFEKVRDCLKPGGKAALQIITIEDAAFETYRRSSDFIQTYIFPGGMLPSPTALHNVATGAQLEVGEMYSMGLDYARTLRCWHSRFEAAWNDGRIPTGFDETFRRLWRYYLAYCEGGFRAGGIDVVQVCLTRPA